MTQSEPIRALIADPDQSLLNYYREGLAPPGFAVVTVTNGLDCLDHLRHWVPDILVLENELPWGGGPGVIALMGEMPDMARVPVVVLFSGQSPAPQPRPSGVWACLSKPVGPAELACTLHALLDGRRGSQDRRGIEP